MLAQVLVVDDEPSYREALASLLRSNGYGVDLAADGTEAMHRFHSCTPDIVLLDVMLPQMSGVEVCRRIRERSQVPIIMLTARTAEVDTVVGLEVGADDYVTKPFRSHELVARIGSLLRRAEGRRPQAVDHTVVPNDVLTIGDVSLDLGRHEVRVAGTLVHLPRKEFEILDLLMRNAGFVVPRDTLIDRVWGGDYMGNGKTLDVHIKRIRARIQEAGGGPSAISTLRGLGYRYDKDCIAVARPAGSGRAGSPSPVAST
jgi:two-component system, OmpR family, response regulator RegX3